MADSRWYAAVLKKNLPGVLKVPASPLATNEVIRVAHALAVAGLASKRSVGHLSRLHGLSIDDLAYDCIADLFRHAEPGDVQQIRTYFAGIEVESVEDEQLVVLFRRLILAKVSNGVFRMYNEVDPVLGRILRNIKIGINSLKNFEEVERFSEPCVVPTLCDHLSHLAPVDPEHLIEGLGVFITRSDRIPDLLSALSKYLRSQTMHSRVVPILQVGLAFRALYGRNRPIDEEVTQPSDPCSSDETARAIQRASRAIRTEFEPVYVDADKVRRSMWDFYFSVIETSLHKKFCENDGSEYSLMRGMQLKVPGLSKEEYRRCHRSKLEHLYHLVERRLLVALRSD